jgi:hypothetical protein
MHVSGDGKEVRVTGTFTNHLPFAHVRKDNGTINSICMKCLTTIAIQEKKSNLAAFEAAHQCNGFYLNSSFRPENQKAERAVSA